MPTKAKAKPKKVAKKITLKPTLKVKKSEEFGAKYLSLLLEGKKTAKNEMFENAKTPLMLIFATDLNGDKELIKHDTLFKLLEGLRILNMKIVIVDTQQPSDINNLSELENSMNTHITWYNPKTDNSGRGREEKEIDRLLLAADMALLFNNHLELIHLLMNYGVITVASEKTPLLENYRPNEETGNAFLFAKRDHWSIFATIVRAMETFKFPYDWKNIIKKIYQ